MASQNLQHPLRRHLGYPLQIERRFGKLPAQRQPCELTVRNIEQHLVMMAVDTNYGMPVGAKEMH